MQKLPPEAFKKDIFYLKPRVCVPKGPKEPWFNSNPVGKNTLAKMVKLICDDANVKGNKTNRSLRATGATVMYQAGVPEKAIKREQDICH